MRHYINLRRYIEAEGLVFRTGLRGRFTVEVEHARTGIIKRRLAFDNLIVDIGLDTFIGGTAKLSQLNQISVGTGNIPPAVDQTDLISRVALTDHASTFGESRGVMPAPTYAQYREFTRVFLEDEANGNLAELGVHYANNTLWARQLFRDEEGDPIVIEKTPEDRLRITYRLELHPQANISEYDISIVTPREPGGVLTTVRTRAWGQQSAGWLIDRSGGTSLGRWSGTRDITEVKMGENSILPEVNGTPSGVSSAGIAIPEDYTPGTFYRDLKIERSVTESNFPTGIGLVAIGEHLFGGGGFASTFTPSIDKQDTDKLVMIKRVSFARM